MPPYYVHWFWVKEAGQLIAPFVPKGFGGYLHFGDMSTITDDRILRERI
jgi:hypothetical protein